MALPEGSLNLQQVVRDLEKRVSELENSKSFLLTYGDTLADRISKLEPQPEVKPDAVPVESTAELGAHE